MHRATSKRSSSFLCCSACLLWPCLQVFVLLSDCNCNNQSLSIMVERRNVNVLAECYCSTILRKVASESDIYSCNECVDFRDRNYASRPGNHVAAAFVFITTVIVLLSSLWALLALSSLMLFSMVVPDSCVNIQYERRKVLLSIACSMVLMCKVPCAKCYAQNPACKVLCAKCCVPSHAQSAVH